MAKYDGLIIPRSYNDYINKSDPAGVAQALQLTGVMDNAPTAQSTKPAKSGGIFAANAVIMASNKTLSGVAISAGSVVRVLFTAALTGSDATTGLTLTYNSNTYAVKVGKNGALANFLANNIDGSYIYCQAYTTLELMFDGSQFIIMGNPVVISSADFSIMAEGSITYTANSTFEKLEVRDYRQQTINFNLISDVGRALIFFDDSSGIRQAIISICNFGGGLRKTEIVNTAGLQVTLSNTQTINCTLIYDSNPQYRVLIF